MSSLNTSTTISPQHIEPKRSNNDKLYFLEPIAYGDDMALKQRTLFQRVKTPENMPSSVIFHEAVSSSELNRLSCDKIVIDNLTPNCNHLGDLATFSSQRDMASHSRELGDLSKSFNRSRGGDALGYRNESKPCGASITQCERKERTEPLALEPKERTESLALEPTKRTEPLETGSLSHITSCLSSVETPPPQTYSKSGSLPTARSSVSKSHVLNGRELRGLKGIPAKISSCVSEVTGKGKVLSSIRTLLVLATLLNLALGEVHTLSERTASSVPNQKSPCPQLTFDSRHSFVRHATDCHVFFMCHKWRSWRLACDTPNTVFSTSRQVCVWKGSEFDDCQHQEDGRRNKRILPGTQNNRRSNRKNIHDVRDEDIKENKRNGDGLIHARYEDILKNSNGKFGNRREEVIMSSIRKQKNADTLSIIEEGKRLARKENIDRALRNLKYVSRFRYNHKLDRKERGHPRTIETDDSPIALIDLKLHKDRNNQRAGEVLKTNGSEKYLPSLQRKSFKLPPFDTHREEDPKIRVFKMFHRRKDENDVKIQRTKRNKTQILNPVKLKTETHSSLPTKSLTDVDTSLKKIGCQTDAKEVVEPLSSTKSYENAASSENVESKSHSVASREEDSDEAGGWWSRQIQNGDHNTMTTGQRRQRENKHMSSFQRNKRQGTPRQESVFNNGGYKITLLEPRTISPPSGSDFKQPISSFPSMDTRNPNTESRIRPWQEHEYISRRTPEAKRYSPRASNNRKLVNQFLRRLNTQERGKSAIYQSPNRFTGTVTPDIVDNRQDTRFTRDGNAEEYSRPLHNDNRRPDPIRRPRLYNVQQQQKIDESQREFQKQGLYQPHGLQRGVHVPTEREVIRNPYQPRNERPRRTQRQDVPAKPRIPNRRHPQQQRRYPDETRQRSRSKSNRFTPRPNYTPHPRSRAKVTQRPRLKVTQRPRVKVTQRPRVKVTQSPRLKVTQSPWYQGRNRRTQYPRNPPPTPSPPPQPDMTQKESETDSYIDRYIKWKEHLKQQQRNRQRYLKHKRNIPPRSLYQRYPNEQKQQQQQEQQQQEQQEQQERQQQEQQQQQHKSEKETWHQRNEQIHHNRNNQRNLKVDVWGRLEIPKSRHNVHDERDPFGNLDTKIINRNNHFNHWETKDRQSRTRDDNFETTTALFRPPTSDRTKKIEMVRNQTRPTPTVAPSPRSLFPQTTVPPAATTTTHDRDEDGEGTEPEAKFVESCGILARPLIVGGRRSRPGQWPWQASLQIVTSTTPWHRCGAVLVHESWLLTAAHCMEGPFFGDIRNWRVVLGDYDLEEESGNEIYRQVVRIVSHPGYIRVNNFPNDVALLEMDRPVDVTSGQVQTACLPHEGMQLTAGTQCWISGWGETRGSGGKENAMNEVPVEVIDLDLCKAMWDRVDIEVLDSQLCLGTGEVGACYGDSGGPLMCEQDGRFFVSGVMSWLIKNCSAHNFPNVFTRLPNYMDWVQDHLGSYHGSAAIDTYTLE